MYILYTDNLAGAYDHTMLITPVLVRSLQCWACPVLGWVTAWELSFPSIVNQCICITRTSKLRGIKFYYCYFDFVDYMQFCVHLTKKIKI